MRFLEGQTASRSTRFSSGAFRIAVQLMLVALLSASAQAQSVAAWGSVCCFQTAVPPGLTDVVAVAGGMFHSLALKSDGTVVGWGNGFDPWPGPSPLSDIVAIAAGGDHNLALRSDGTVVAWGSNDEGESTVPPGLTGVVAISAGLYHSLALKSDGTVVGWGHDGAGQSTPPPGLTNVVAVSAGFFHSMALKSDGTVVVWGSNRSDQLIVPPGLTGVTAIAAGADHNLVLKGDGTVVSWGADVEGASSPPQDLANVAAIAASSGHNLALKDDGTVVAWGSNRNNESTVPEGLSSVVAVAAGGAHSLAIVSNTAPDARTQTVTRAADTARRVPIAMVSDESPISGLSLSIDGGASSSVNGVTVSGLGTDHPDLVTADVNTTCGATNAVFFLRVTDPSGLSTDARLDVIVTPEGTPPTLELPGNVVTSLPADSSATSMPVTFTVTATDNCGGAAVWTTPASGSLFPVGTTTVLATATDAAGNTATGSFTVTVQFAFNGFFAPVSNLPTVNQVNAGRAIPIKFSLTGNKGLNVLAAGSPTSNGIACTFSGDVSDVTETATAGASELSYDAATDQYTYVWKTSKAWANSCRQLVITLRDGSTHVANFEFK